MELLNRVYLENTIQAWLVAACILIVVFAILKGSQRVGIRRLSRLSASTDNEIDDFLVNILKGTKVFILLIASAYVASCAITLKPSIAALWQKAVILALILQGGVLGERRHFFLARPEDSKAYG